MNAFFSFGGPPSRLINLFIPRTAFRELQFLPYTLQYTGDRTHDKINRALVVLLKLTHKKTVDNFDQIV